MSFFCRADPTFWFFLILGGAITVNLAEDADPPPKETARVEEVDVQSSPILEDFTVSDRGETTVVVSQEQIRALGARDVAAGLRRVPGVVVSRFNHVGGFGGGAGGSLTVRGHGAGRPGAELRTTIDGVPRQVSVWGHPLIDHLPLLAQDRIEVSRAPSPVREGAGFASINLVPQRARTEGHRFRMQLGAGSHATRDASAHFLGRSGRVDYALGASQSESDGHRPASAGRVRAVTAQLGTQLSESWDLVTRVDHSDGWAEDPGAITEPSLGAPPVFDSESELFFAKLTRRAPGDRLEVRVYHEDGALDWFHGSSDPWRSITDYAASGLRARWSRTLDAASELVTGVDVDRRRGRFLERRAGSPDTPTRVRFEDRAGYVEYTRKFAASRWSRTLSAGARLHDSREFGTTTGLRVGGTARRGRNTVFLNASRGFQHAGPWAAVMSGAWGDDDAWRTLDAERIDHVELGWQHVFQSRLHLHVAIFRDAVDNALRFVAPPPPPPHFANIGHYTSEGLEASVSWHPRPGLSVYAGGQRAVTSPDDTPYSPEWSWSAGLHLSRGELSLDIDAQGLAKRFVGNPRFGVDPVPLPSMTLVAARLAWQPERSRFELWLHLENLCDETYEYRPGYPMPGRSASTGLSWEL